MSEEPNPGAGVDATLKAPTRVVLIEDHPLTLDTLRRGLQEVPGIVVSAVARSAEEAQRMTIFGEAHLALVDVSLPDMSGLQLVRVLRSSHPALRCLMVSGHALRTYALDALAAGAWGYVVKGSPTELLQAVQGVLAGNVYFSRILNGRNPH